MSSAPINLYTSRLCDGEYGLYVALRERADNVLNEHLNPGYDNTAAGQLLRDVAAHRKDYSDLLMSESTARGQTQTRQILQELALHRGQLWQNSRVLRVKFLCAEPGVHRQIEAVAKTWGNYANIRFDFVPQGEAEIRIGFGRSGSWSMVGTDALTVTAQDKPTMNFDLFDETTSPAAFEATILHEFGHCLGCVHEHQSPAANVRWNKDLIYWRLFQAYGWEPAKVDHNFFDELSKQDVTNSTYDPHSIMHYSFPPEFTFDYQSTPHNTHLSAQDIAFIGQCYPFSPTPATATLLKG